MRIRHDQRGFTLPELLVVTGVFVIFTVASIALLRIKDASAELLDGQRQTNVAMLAQALQRYKADKGHYPGDIPAEKKGIGSAAGKYPLCRILVPEFLPDIPTDPEAGSKYRNAEREETPETCETEGVDYDIGYDIVAKDGTVTISAPNATTGTIEITIR